MLRINSDEDLSGKKLTLGQEVLKLAVLLQPIHFFSISRVGMY